MQSATTVKNPATSLPALHTQHIKSELHVDGILQQLKDCLDEFRESSKAVEFNKWSSFFTFDISDSWQSNSLQVFGFMGTGMDIRHAVKY